MAGKEREDDRGGFKTVYLKRLEEESEDAVFQGSDATIKPRCEGCLLFVGQLEVPLKRYLWGVYQTLRARKESEQRIEAVLEKARARFARTAMEKGLLTTECCTGVCVFYVFPIPRSYANHTSPDQSEDDDDDDAGGEDERYPRDNWTMTEADAERAVAASETCLRDDRMLTEVWKKVLGTWPENLGDDRVLLDVAEYLKHRHEYLQRVEEARRGLERRC